jgi:hypothetical protein
VAVRRLPVLNLAGSVRVARDRLRQSSPRRLGLTHETACAVTGKAHQLDIKVQNKTDSLVAFKIKTTAPKRYMVRPTQDYIEPREDKVLKVRGCIRAARV